jgi:hypothetical protein
LQNNNKKKGGGNKIQCGKREMFTHIKKKEKKKKERAMKIDFARESKAYIEKEICVKSKICVCVCVSENRVREEEHKGSVYMFMCVSLYFFFSLCNILREGGLFYLSRI